MYVTLYSLVFTSTVSSNGMANVTTPPQTTISPHDTLSGLYVYDRQLTVTCVSYCMLNQLTCRSVWTEDIEAEEATRN